MLHKTKRTIVQYLHLTFFYSYISKGNISFDIDRETGLVLDWIPATDTKITPTFAHSVKNALVFALNCPNLC